MHLSHMMHMLTMQIGSLLANRLIGVDYLVWQFLSQQQFPVIGVVVFCELLVHIVSYGPALSRLCIMKVW